MPYSLCTYDPLDVKVSDSLCTQSAEQGCPRTSWGWVVLVLWCGMSAAFSVAKMGAALPVLQRQFELGHIEAGLVASVQSVLAASMGFFVGSWVGRWRASRALLMGMAALTLGSGFGAISDGYAALLATRILEGGGLILVVVAAPALLAGRTLPSDHGMVYGIWSVYMAAGSALMLALAPLLLAGGKWQTLWWFVCIASGLPTLLLFVCLRTDSASSDSPPGQVQSMFRLPGHPHFWLLPLASMLYVSQLVTLLVWLPSTLIGLWKASMTTATLCTALLLMTNGMGSIFCGRLLKRQVRWERVLLVVAVTLLLLLVSLACLPDLVAWPMTVSFLGATLMFAGGCLPPLFLAGISTIARDARLFSTGTGMLIQGSHCGQFIGPPLFGAIVSWYYGDWRAGLLLLCGLSAMLVVTAVVLLKTTPSQQAS